MESAPDVERLRRWRNRGILANFGFGGWIRSLHYTYIRRTHKLAEEIGAGKRRHTEKRIENDDYPVNTKQVIRVIRFESILLSA